MRFELPASFFTWFGGISTFLENLLNLGGSCASLASGKLGILGRNLWLMMESWPLALLSSDPEKLLFENRYLLKGSSTFLSVV